MRSARGMCRQSRKLKPKTATTGAKFSRARIDSPRAAAARAANAFRRRREADQARSAAQSAKTDNSAISQTGK